MKTEVDEAEREGVKFHFLTAPVKALTHHGRLTGIECIKMELGEPDESGRRSPIPVKDSNFEIEGDHLIVAIGQTLDKEAIVEEFQYTSSGILWVDPVTFKTNVESVFAGGDVTKGPGSVIEAIGAGRRAASSIDLFLNGDGVIEEVFAERSDHFPYPGKRGKEFADLKRVEPPALPLAGRHHMFSEVVQCFNGEQAVKEASRCLQCDLELRLARGSLMQNE